MDAPRFAVDRTMGRLARWLRLLGFDAICRPDLPGRRLLTLAAREGRIVLTREEALTRARTTARILLVAADRFRDQLREIDRSVALGGREQREPRCGDCNAALVQVEREALPRGIPEYVLATQSDFRRCPSCRRIFWPATHWQRMVAEIEALSLTAPAEL